MNKRRISAAEPLKFVSYSWRAYLILTLFLCSFQRIGLLQGLGSLFAVTSLLIDLSQGLVGQNERGVHGDGLLCAFQSLVVVLGLAQGVREIIVIVSVEGVAIERLV